ncbi:MAG: hypothetical protein GYB40_04570 [Vibrionaceae bacterium]|nr:hypothetical protein [Vibrionaceae bacterium]
MKYSSVGLSVQPGVLEVLILTLLDIPIEPASSCTFLRSSFLVLSLCKLDITDLLGAQRNVSAGFDKRKAL